MAQAFCHGRNLTNEVSALKSLFLKFLPKYAETQTNLNGDEHQPKEGGHTGKIVGGVIVGAVVTACVVSGLKKRCIPFVKRITRTDDLSKEVRQAIKDGEITNKEAKAMWNL